MAPQIVLEQIKAARSGDRAAFAELVRRYQGLVSATTFSRIGDFQQSEDLAQETFLIAWKELANLGDLQKFPAWLCGIARNLSNNWLRNRRRDPLAEASPTLEHVSETVADKTSVQDAQNDDARLVWSSLERIPENYREPLVMFYRHDAEISDIAAALELTEETVRQRLSRGRKMLKAEVERTVEKTLASTRPDSAFTLAVLAALPLAASAGCSATSKTMGLFSGVSTMSGFGIVWAVLGGIVLLLVQVSYSLLWVVGAFYLLWLAVQNSPTHRTRRFMLQAALDLNLLFLFFSIANEPLVFLLALLRDFIRNPTTDSIPAEWFFFITSILPSLLLLAGFAFHVVLRWQTILYEEKVFPPPVLEAENKKKASSEAVPDDSEPNPLYKIFANEIQTGKNVLKSMCRCQEYFMTVKGLKTKWAIYVWLAALFVVLSFQGEVRLALKVVTMPRMPFPDLFLLYASILVSFVISIAVQIYLFRFVLNGINASKDDKPIETSSEWNFEEFSPANRRLLLRDMLILFAMIPLLTLFLMTGLLTARSWYGYQFEPAYHGACSSVETVLIALVALWIGKDRTRRRNRGFAAMYLLTAVISVVLLEWTPLSYGIVALTMPDPVTATLPYSFLLCHIAAAFFGVFYGLVAVFYYSRAK